MSTPILSQPLTRAEAEKIARRVFAVDEVAVPAVAELLLLIENRQAPRELRRVADQAADLFEPFSEARLPEPAAFQALRWAFYANDPQERRQALPYLLAHLDRWAA